MFSESEKHKWCLCTFFIRAFHLVYVSAKTFNWCHFYFPVWLIIFIGVLLRRLHQVRWIKNAATIAKRIKHKNAKFLSFCSLHLCLFQSCHGLLLFRHYRSDLALAYYFAFLHFSDKLPAFWTIKKNFFFNFLLLAVLLDIVHCHA